MMMMMKCILNEMPTYLTVLYHMILFLRYNLHSEYEKIYDFEIPKTGFNRSNILEQFAILC